MFPGKIKNRQTGHRDTVGGGQQTTQGTWGHASGQFGALGIPVSVHLYQTWTIQVAALW